MSDLFIHNLHVGFPTREGIVRAVDGINLSIKPGEIVGLVGESGSGKSVTCNSILQLLPSPPAQFGAGKIDWSGKNLLSETESSLQKIRGKEISMIFQDPMSSLNPYLPVLDQAAEPLVIHKLCGWDDVKARAQEILQKVGVSCPQTPPFLSPRIFRRDASKSNDCYGVVTEPNLLLADEPTTVLDVTVQVKVLKILKDLCADHK